MSDAPPEKDQPSPPDADEEPGRGAFSVVIPCACVFVLTIFLMIAAAFGQPGTPLSRFFDEYGLTIIAVEAVLLVGVSVVSMSVDRYLTTREAERTGDSRADTAGGD